MSELLHTLIHEQVESGQAILGTSFNLVPGQVGSSDFLANISLPPWVATDWTFTAMGWRNQGTPVSANVPPWASLTSPFMQPLPSAPVTFGAFGLADTASNLASVGPLLRFMWGSGGLLEVAWIDYPISGLTVGGLHGSQLRVCVDNITFTAAQGVPILGGWATPGDVTERRTAPVLTYAGIVITAGTTVHAWVPPRARGYRVYSPDAVSGNNWWNGGVSVQTTAAAVQLARDYDLQNSTWSTMLTEVNRERFFPLDPRATRVELSTPGTVTTCTVGIQWLIDLG